MLQMYNNFQFIVLQ